MTRFVKQRLDWDAVLQETAFNYFQIYALKPNSHALKPNEL